MTVYLEKQLVEPAAGGNAANDRDSGFRRWLRAAMRRWRRRRMITALQSLNDRMLDDIGLRRSDIPRMVETFGPRELMMAPMAQDACARNEEHDAYRQAA